MSVRQTTSGSRADEEPRPHVQSPRVGGASRQPEAQVDASSNDRLREIKWRWSRRVRRWDARVAVRAPAIAREVHQAVRFGVGMYARCELPRCVGMMEACVAAFEGAWPRDGMRETRAMWHGYRLRLNCADYFQRLTYALRRYPDVPTQMVLWRTLRPGDTFIDGGANVGMISLLAAWRVGTAGRVHAFEPNPAMLQQLHWHVQSNNLGGIIEVHEAGLGEVRGVSELIVPGDDNFGAGTFAPPPARYHGQHQSLTAAEVVRLDDLALPIHGRVVVKLDIEGYEVRALRGMANFIEQHKPLILTEVNAEMLAQAGTSPGVLADFLMSREYRPYAYTTSRAIIRQRRLVLRPLQADSLSVDVAWVHGQRGDGHVLL